MYSCYTKPAVDVERSSLRSLQIVENTGRKKGFVVLNVLERFLSKGIFLGVKVRRLDFVKNSVQIGGAVVALPGMAILEFGRLLKEATFWNIALLWKNILGVDLLVKNTSIIKTRLRQITAWVT